MVIVLLGVAGSGKSTVGQLLARALGFEFCEGDDYHSESNKEKMRAGIPLTDVDRWPWLTAIRDLIATIVARNGNAVLTCSALKQSYRDYIWCEDVRFVYLRAELALLHDRLAQRKGHFFDPTLLESQLATLEEPRNALVIDAAESPTEIVSDVVCSLR
jgi:gluconokinase